MPIPLCRTTTATCRKPSSMDQTAAEGPATGNRSAVVLINMRRPEGGRPPNLVLFILSEIRAYVKFFSAMEVRTRSFHRLEF
jgi:hypothetical protein